MIPPRLHAITSSPSSLQSQASTIHMRNNNSLIMPQFCCPCSSDHSCDSKNSNKSRLTRTYVLSHRNRITKLPCKNGLTSREHRDS
uniref:Uncharacterized protein n=1 Tax=Physcomitrium patens TaxID=3218 RepID=A0A2K1IYQ6_PHYPA|nr:hypothetical protein PHYPA_024227 [Physcomitrium patens]